MGIVGSLTPTAKLALAGLAILNCIALAAPAAAQEAYVVTYIEVAPQSEAKAAALLRNWASAVRTNQNNIAIAPLQRRGVSNHFAIFEIWKDQKSAEAQAASDAGRQFRQELAPLSTAPNDERPYVPLQADAGRSKSAMQASDPATVFVLTHVDIIPPKKDEGVSSTSALAAPSRKEPGNLAFDVLQQASRANHMTLFEVWKTQADLEAHAALPSIKAYRNALLPMGGALYDQRTYQVIR